MFEIYDDILKGILTGRGPGNLGGSPRAVLSGKYGRVGQFLKLIWPYAALRVMALGAKPGPFGGSSDSLKLYPKTRVDNWHRCYISCVILIIYHLA